MNSSLGLTVSLLDTLATGDRRVLNLIEMLRGNHVSVEEMATVILHYLRHALVDQRLAGILLGASGHRIGKQVSYMFSCAGIYSNLLPSSCSKS
jgi:hypothetical protein